MGDRWPGTEGGMKTAELKKVKDQVKWFVLLPPILTICIISCINKLIKITELKKVKVQVKWNKKNQEIQEEEQDMVSYK